MDLGSFKIVEQANQIGENIWEEVVNWRNFEKDTIGKQMVRAADSISANLSEAHGRFAYADRKRFAYYARGSLFETINWLEKSLHRGLIDKEFGKNIYAELSLLAMRINSYIKYLKQTNNS